MAISVFMHQFRSVFIHQFRGARGEDTPIIISKKHNQKSEFFEEFRAVLDHGYLERSGCTALLQSPSTTLLES
jgi:hypothetical protein